MKIDKKMFFERMKVGYFEPPENTHTCKRCGAVVKMTKNTGKRGSSAPYFCRRHKFLVRKDGCCNDQSPAPYHPEPEQIELGELFEGK